eukprot:gene7990-12282_t
MLVGGCLSLTTELVVQKAIEKQPKVEVARCGRAAAWRMFFHVPILHTWLNFLEKHVTGASVRAVVTKKVLCDQLVASPIVHAMFFYYMTFAEGGTLQDGHQKLSDCWLRTMCFSYMLWPVAHMFTFGYTANADTPEAAATTQFEVQVVPGISKTVLLREGMRTLA